MTLTDFENLDKLVAEMQRARKRHDDAKKETSLLWETYEELRAKVSLILRNCGKTKYYVDGLGTVSIVDKYNFKMPKDPEDKTKFLNYIKDNFGAETLTNLITINHNSLNSFLSEEKEKVMSGEAVDIPGMESPVGYQELRFRKG